MMQNGFESGANQVALSKPALRSGSDRTIELADVVGYGSGGARYAYVKSGTSRSSYTIEMRVSPSERYALEDFFYNKIRGTQVSFTWWDRGTARTIRLVSPSFFQVQTHPTKYLVRWEVEELALRDILVGALDGWDGTGDPFLYAISLRVLAPVWVLRIWINGVLYWISDDEVPIGPDLTLPWVRSWGELRDAVSGDLAEFKVQDFTVSLLNDFLYPGGGVVPLAESHDLEGSPVELCLSFRNVDAEVLPPRVLFTGYVRDVEIPDDNTLELTIEDESQRLRNYLGTKVSLELFPDVDPDDVGKVVPIVFGTVEKLPAIAVDAGVQTTLPANLGTGTTYFALSSLVGLGVGSVVQIDDEQILITATSGNIITNCTRGYNSTLAANHLKGAVVWEQQALFIYLAADHPVASINKVYGRVGQGVLDVTAVCTVYTGQPGDEYPDYPGRAVVTVPDMITTTQAVNLALSNGLGTADTIGLINSLYVSDTITLGDTITILQGNHTHPTSTSTQTVTLDTQTRSGSGWSYASNLPDKAIDGNYSTYMTTDGLGGTATFKRVSAVGSGTPIRFRVGYSMSMTSNPGYERINIYLRGSLVLTVTPTQVGQATQYSGWITLNSWADLYSYGDTYVQVVLSSWQPKYYEIFLEVETGTATTYSAATGVGRSGGIIKNGGVAQAGSINKSGTVTLTGTVTLSGNSVANTMIADELLVDLTGYSSDPPDVFSTLLSTYCGDNSFSQAGTLPVGYALNGAITEYRQAIYWLDYLAFQCRSYFRKSKGVARLICRPDALAGATSISAVRLEDGVRVYPRRKGPIDNVVNKINVLYRRDWSMSAGAGSYRSSKLGTDETSIDVYGEKERPALFQFDFVTSDAMAEDLLAFYLARYAWRYWVHEVSGFLNLAGFDFGDVVSLDFAGGKIGEVLGVGIKPGDAETIDKVNLTVAVS